MLEQVSVLKVKIGERLYKLELDPKSPLGEAYDAITQLRSFVIDRINQENEASKPKTEKPPQEE